jgi:hypothetical protein
MIVGGSASPRDQRTARKRLDSGACFAGCVGPGRERLSTSSGQGLVSL